MTLFDRYLIKSFWSYFFGAWLTFITLFVAVDALSTMVQFPGLSVSTVLRYYAFYIPEISQQLMPVACLLGALLTFSTLSKNGELVALFASGLGLKRLSLPLLSSVILISALVFVVGDQWLPQMIKQKNFIYYNEIEKKPGKFSFVKTNRIWYRSKNTIFNIKTLNPEAAQAQGLTMYFFSDSWDLLQMITASQVNLSGNVWQLKSGSVTLFTADSSFPLTSDFEEKTLTMSEDLTDLKNTGQTSDLLSQVELREFIKKNKEAGLETARYEVDFHSKFSFAFAGLVMCLLGIPFSVSRSRSGGALVNVGICIALVFCYWVLYSSGITLGSHGTLSPAVAAWAPNFVMGISSLFLFRRVGY